MFNQDTRSCVSGQERRHTVVCQRPRKTPGTRNVLFTRTAKSPISASHIFITTRQICTKFIYFMPSIYTTSQTKFEGNRLSISRDMYFQNCPIFITFFFFFFFAPNQPNQIAKVNSLFVTVFLSNLEHK